MWPHQSLCHVHTAWSMLLVTLVCSSNHISLVHEPFSARIPDRHRGRGGDNHV